MSPLAPKETLIQLLHHLGFADAQVEELEVEGQLMLDVKTDDPGRLIGRQGSTLGDLQYLLNRIVHRGDDSTPRIVLDVGGYRRQAREQLIKRAREGAEKVRRWGDVIELEPMNAYDRRIVHQALKEDPDIETHSVEVEGSEKKVILLRPRRVLPRPDPAV
jgi:spoIIIJ-associated protein